MLYQTTMEDPAPGPKSSNDITIAVVAVVVVVIVTTILLAVVSLMIYRHKHMCNSKNLLIQRM